ncbi:MAG: helix-turn-helix transcriptional regulator [Lachnospiraceae bacterium]|nr:helix-turn-helix transcriptional regulator [Lachnospiraceae bacterium]
MNNDRKSLIRADVDGAAHRTEDSMDILAIKSLWPERKGFDLISPNIGDMYIFIHFLTPAVLYTKSGEIAVRAGGCVFFAANQPRHFASPDCDLLHDWFHADPSFGALLTRYGITCEQVYYPENSGRITELVTELELEQVRHKKFYQSISDTFCEQLVIELARSADEESEQITIDPKTRELLINVRAEVHMQFDRDWSVEDMAGLAGLSASRFYYLYKHVFGISPLKDLCSVRIQRAKNLLMRSHCSVEEVAELSGYKNIYHFIRQFKKMTGVTPGRFKKDSFGGEYIR